MLSSYMMGYGAVVTSLYLYVKNSYFALGGVNFELVRWEKMQIHGNNFLGYIKEIRSWLV